MTQIRSEEAPAAKFWTPAWWIQDARWLALLAPALLFAGHLPNGAISPKTSVTLGLAASLLLLASLLHPLLRRELARARGLKWPVGLFAAVLVVGLWSMTPFVPGGPHPMWAYTHLGSAAATIDKSQTLLELTKLLGLGAIFALGLAAGGEDRRARLALDAIIAMGAALALWSFVTMMGGVGGASRERLAWPFVAANTAATLFAMLLLITLGPLLSAARSAGGKHRLEQTAPYAGAALIFMACILATASRGGALSTVAGFIAFSLLMTFGGRMKFTRASLFLLGALLVVGAGVFFGGNLLVQRLVTEGLDPDSRRRLLEVHWEAFKASPLMGYGLGTVDIMSRQIVTATNMREIWTARNPHNVYLTWLEQGGILGAVPMFACIGMVILGSARNALRRQRLTTLLYGLLAADVAVLTHGMTDFALETYSMAALWTFLLGLQFRAAQGSSAR